MLKQDDFDSINWLPNFMPISLPKNMTHDDHLSFAISDIQASFREILACDFKGKIFHSDLNYTQTLKMYDSKL